MSRRKEPVSGTGRGPRGKVSGWYLLLDKTPGESTAPDARSTPWEDVKEMEYWLVRHLGDVCFVPGVGSSLKERGLRLNKRYK